MARPLKARLTEERRVLVSEVFGKQASAWNPSLVVEVTIFSNKRKLILACSPCCSVLAIFIN